jgi:hypothetical protein
MADYFKMYKIYCGAHRQGINLVNDLTNTNVKFKDFLEVLYLCGSATCRNSVAILPGVVRNLEMSRRSQL